jgi:photosystem II stability/assembly factor-like uncharacterized protein
MIFLGAMGGGLRIAPAQGWKSLGTQIRQVWTDPQDPNSAYANVFGDVEYVVRYIRGRPDGWFQPPGFPFAINPHNSKTIHAVGSSGAFTSTDGGENWTTTATWSEQIGVDSLAIDPRNPSVLFAGTTTISGTFRGKARVFKSSDGGHTWVTPTIWLNGFEACGWMGVPALALDPHIPGTVYATTSDCNDQGGFLWKSTDGGTTWQRTDLIVGWAGTLAVDPRNAGTLYAGAHAHGVAKSTDGGASWRLVNSGLPEFFPVTSLSINPQNPGTLYAASSLFPGGLFKTIDGGATWTPFNQGLENVTISSLAVAPRGPETLYAGTTSGLFRMIAAAPVLSLNSAQYCIGNSWTLRVSNGVPGTDARLVGISNGNSWEIPFWRRTDLDGSFSESGIFLQGTAGTHTLTVEIDGFRSNTVSFVVSQCSSSTRVDR